MSVLPFQCPGDLPTCCVPTLLLCEKLGYLPEFLPWNLNTLIFIKCFFFFSSLERTWTDVMSSELVDS